MNKYLLASNIIDWKNPSIQGKAKELSYGMTDPVDIARACFLYVRDNIKHSYDYQLNPVTCQASDVLKNKKSLCLATFQASSIRSEKSGSNRVIW